MLDQQLIKEFNLQVATQLESLQEVLQWFERLIAPSLPDKIIWQCEVALSEAFTNIVRHAHQHLPSTTPIEIQICLFQQFIEIKIWDWGESFDLMSQLQSNKRKQSNPLEKENGRGLEIVEKLMDEFQYLRLENKRNCSIMKKSFFNY
jgi:serine/threonine-protein kinase RsbW